jgi:predicted N-acyltransferase
VSLSSDWQKLMVRIETSLIAGRSGLTPDELAEIAADGHLFASIDWLEMLEELRLGPIIGGAVSLGFAVTREDQRPVALIPLLRIHGRGTFASYSIRKHYFEKWMEDLHRAHPLVQARFKRVVRSVKWFRSLLDISQTPMDDVLLVGSPLASRTQVAVAPSARSSRSAIHQSIIRTLQRYALRQQVPLWFYSLPGEKSRWGQSLMEQGCQQSFDHFDSVVDVEPFRRFADYVQSFRRSTRRAIQREISLADRLGTQIDHGDDVEQGWRDLVFVETRSRLPTDDTRLHPNREFFQSMGRHFGPRAETFFAQREGNLLGYHLVLRNERRGELVSFRLAQQPSSEPKDRFSHSTLAYYEPIRRAIALGYRRVWLGSDNPHAAYLRGAYSVPVYSYFWFPRHWDRWCVHPYLQRFGEITQARWRYAIERPAPWRRAIPSFVRSGSRPNF